MPLLFNKGSIVGIGEVRYEKLGDNVFDWWVCLASTYIKEVIINDKKETIVAPESELPLYRKDGSLNRFGFKWTDEQVQLNYKIIKLCLT